MVNYIPIEVVAADPRWPEEYERHAAALRAALGGVAVRIDHIGSTAVPGLDAKPTIDIQVSVADVEGMAYRPATERLGYAFHPNSLDDEGHRLFSLPARLVHAHFCAAGSQWERIHLLFRDYLRSHPDAAAAYAAFKHQLAGQHPDDRLAYTAAKIGFIGEMMLEAERWAAESAWRV